MNELWKRSLAEWVYGVLWISSVAAFWHFSYGTSNPAPAVMLLAICAATFFFRIVGLFNLLPWFVFATILLKFFSIQSWGIVPVPAPRPIMMTGTEKFLLGLFTLLTIALTSRLQTVLVPDHQKVVSERITYVPMKRSPQRTLGIISYLLSLLVLVAAWLFAGYLNSDFAWATSNANNFEQYRNVLRGGIRLVPWAFNGIRLTIYLAMMFLVAHSVLSYLRCRHNKGQMSAMLLRHELWIWNRWEQKAIAKAARKNS